ncbi:hypothetical protein FDUTEX481_08953 [Tolypothrix sp. PCC 7601]|nr:hypothetical protein FDUTEX481_08953 [Tolypothrix sp. PCC 7601]
MFQKINDPKPVIASEMECSVRVASRREAIAKSCNYERVYAIATLRERYANIPLCSIRNDN